MTESPGATTTPRKRYDNTFGSANQSDKEARSERNESWQGLTPAKTRVNLGHASAYYFSDSLPKTPVSTILSTKKRSRLSSAHRDALDVTMEAENESDLSSPDLSEAFANKSTLSMGSSSSSDSEGGDLLNISIQSDPHELTASNFVQMSGARQRANDILKLKAQPTPGQTANVKADKENSSRTAEVLTQYSAKKEEKGNSKVTVKDPLASNENVSVANDHGYGTPLAAANSDNPPVSTRVTTPNSLRSYSPSMRSRVKTTPGSARKYAEELRSARTAKDTRVVAGLDRRMSTGSVNREISSTFSTNRRKSSIGALPTLLSPLQSDKSGASEDENVSFATSKDGIRTTMGEATMSSALQSENTISTTSSSGLESNLSTASSGTDLDEQKGMIEDIFDGIIMENTSSTVTSNSTTKSGDGPSIASSEDVNKSGDTEQSMSTPNKEASPVDSMLATTDAKSPRSLLFRTKNKSLPRRVLNPKSPLSPAFNTRSMKKLKVREAPTESTEINDGLTLTPTSQRQPRQPGIDSTSPAASTGSSTGKSPKSRVNLDTLLNEYTSPTAAINDGSNAPMDDRSQGSKRKWREESVDETMDERSSQQSPTEKPQSDYSEPSHKEHNKRRQNGSDATESSATATSLGSDLSKNAADLASLLGSMNEIDRTQETSESEKRSGRDSAGLYDKNEGDQDETAGSPKRSVRKPRPEMTTPTRKSPRLLGVARSKGGPEHAGRNKSPSSPPTYKADLNNEIEAATKDQEETVRSPKQSIRVESRQTSTPTRKSPRLLAKTEGYSHRVALGHPKSSSSPSSLKRSMQRASENDILESPVTPMGAYLERQSRLLISSTTRNSLRKRQSLSTSFISTPSSAESDTFKNGDNGDTLVTLGSLFDGIPMNSNGEDTTATISEVQKTDAASLNKEASKDSSDSSSDRRQRKGDETNVIEKSDPKATIESKTATTSSTSTSFISTPSSADSDAFESGNDGDTLVTLGSLFDGIPVNGNGENASTIPEGQKTHATSLNPSDEASEVSSESSSDKGQDETDDTNASKNSDPNTTIESKEATKSNSLPSEDITMTSEISELTYDTADFQSLTGLPKQQFDQEQSPPTSRVAAKGVLSSALKKRKRDDGTTPNSKRNVGFRSPEAAEYNKGSPSDRITPMLKSKAKKLYVIPANNTEVSERGESQFDQSVATSTSSPILEIKEGSEYESTMTRGAVNEENKESPTNSPEAMDIEKSPVLKGGSSLQESDFDFSPTVSENRQAEESDSSSNGDEETEEVTTEINLSMEELIRTVNPESGANDLTYQMSKDDGVLPPTDESDSPSSTGSAMDHNEDPTMSLELNLQDMLSSGVGDLSDSNLLEKLAQPEDQHEAGPVSVERGLASQFHLAEQSPTGHLDQTGPSIACGGDKENRVASDLDANLLRMKEDGEGVGMVEATVELMPDGKSPNVPTASPDQLVVMADSPGEKSSGTTGSRRRRVSLARQTIRLSLSEGDDEEMDVLTEGSKTVDLANLKSLTAARGEATVVDSSDREAVLNEDEHLDVTPEEIRQATFLQVEAYNVDSLLSSEENVLCFDQEKMTSFLSMALDEIRKENSVEGEEHMRALMNENPDLFLQLQRLIRSDGRENELVKGQLRHCSSMIKAFIENEWLKWEKAVVLAMGEGVFEEIAREIEEELVEIRRFETLCNRADETIAGMEGRSVRRARRRSMNRRKTTASAIEKQVWDLEAQIRKAKEELNEANAAATAEESLAVALSEMAESDARRRATETKTRYIENEFVLQNSIRCWTLITSLAEKVEVAFTKFSSKSSIVATFDLSTPENVSCNLRRDPRLYHQRQPKTQRPFNKWTSQLCSDFVKLKIEHLIAEANRTEVGCSNEIGPFMERLEWEIGRIEMTADEMQTLDDRYTKCELVEPSLPEARCALSVELKGQPSSSVVKTTFDLFDSYPFTALTMTLDVVKGDIDVETLLKHLQKQSKPGYGYMLRCCSLIEAFPSAARKVKA